MATEPASPLHDIISSKEAATSGDFLTECDGTFLRITINHPDEGNAMTDGMVEELTSLLGGAAERARCVILQGKGKDFCVGRAPHGRKPMATSEALDVRRASGVIFDCYQAFRRTPIPVVTVITGRALGFGCGLAILGDITIAAESAQFQLPEFGHNIMPTMAMSAMLPKVSGKTLMYVVYSTALLDAARARELGLVNEVAPDRDLNAAVDRICAIIAKAPLPAILAVKEYASHAPDMPLQGAVEYARNLHATINSSHEMKKKG
jgi:enoyl-CoA hydratase